MINPFNSGFIGGGAAGGGGGGSVGSWARLEEQQTSGTGSGNATAGSWETRTLNTEVEDPDSIVTLSSNQFTLAAGTYRIWAESSMKECGTARLRLRNITDSTTDINGVNSGVSSSAGNGSWMNLGGQITIAAGKTFEIQSRVAVTNSSGDAWGSPLSSGENEVYLRVEIVKVA